MKQIISIHLAVLMSMGTLYAINDWWQKAVYCAGFFTIGVGSTLLYQHLCKKDVILKNVLQPYQDAGVAVETHYEGTPNKQHIVNMRINPGYTYCMYLDTVDNSVSREPGVIIHAREALHNGNDKRKVTLYPAVMPHNVEVDARIDKELADGCSYAHPSQYIALVRRRRLVPDRRIVGIRKEVTNGAIALLWDNKRQAYIMATVSAPDYKSSKSK